MNTFNSFLDHVMENFAASYPYGLSKTEVVRITYLAWCIQEAQIVRKVPVEVEA